MTIEICTVGGYNEVGKNMTAVKVGDDVVILDMGVQLDNYFESAFPTETLRGDFFGGGQEVFIDASEAFFSTLGLTVDGRGGWGNDVTVTYKPTKDATAQEFNFNPRDEDTDPKGKIALFEWIKGVVPTETIDELIKKGVISPVKTVSGRRKNNDLDSLGAAGNKYECIEGKLIHKETGLEAGTCDG